MSEQWQGPGWWMASDGRWYPPEQAPGAAPPQWGGPGYLPAGPPSPGMGTGAKVGIAVVVVLVALVGLAVLGSVVGVETDDAPIADDNELDVPLGPVPPGSQRARGENVSIIVPKGWTVIDTASFGPDGEDLDELDLPPELSEAGAAAFAQGAVLVAIDNAAEGFPDNVNILRIPGPATSLAVIEDSVTPELESFGAEVAGIDTVRLTTGEALEVTYTILALDGSSAPVDGRQYYLNRGGVTYVISVSLNVGSDVVARDFAESFRVG